MDDISDKTVLEVIYVVVHSGLGSKVLKVAKHNGIQGGTIILGKGTIKNRLLEFLDLTDVRKEIVIMITEQSKANNVLEIINKEFHFQKQNHGIAFSMSVTELVGSRHIKSKSPESNREENTMYQAIYTIVDKGKAEIAIDAATAAGARGGTIMNGRGSGIHETNILFAMPIEPEKEIVMILSEEKSTNAIVASIRKELNIDEPGNGIIYIQNVNKTFGLF